MAVDINLANRLLAAFLVCQDVQIVIIQNLVPDVCETWHGVQVRLIKVHRNRLLKQQAVWDFILGEALEIQNQAEV